MSRLDLLATAPRPIEAQSRSSAGADGQEFGGDPAGADFGALLEGCSSKPQMGRDGPDLQEVGSADAETGRGNGNDGDLRATQALPPDTAGSGGAVGMPPAQYAGSAMSIIESLLPRILTRFAESGSAEAGQAPSALASSGLPLPQTPGSDIALVPRDPGAKLAVSVQNQETHFRPIVEGLSSMADQAASGAIESSSSQGNPVPEMPNATDRMAPLAKSETKAAQILPSLSAAAGTMQSTDEQQSIRATDPRTSLEPEPTTAPAPAGPKSEAGSLPPSTLQDLARAVVDDVQSAADDQKPSFQHVGLNRVATARASAGVLRVLDLQLKPAELGLVTIRMRLSGDSIEMEIRAHSEDTAELLRSDADKLSNLLRASGYRPDNITIQTAEPAPHDRSSLQRPAQGSLQQGQSFDQGANSSHGNSSRRQDDRYNPGPDVNNDGKEGTPPGGSGLTGVYL